MPHRTPMGALPCSASTVTIGCSHGTHSTSGPPSTTRTPTLIHSQHPSPSLNRDTSDERCPRGEEHHSQPPPRHIRHSITVMSELIAAAQGAVPVAYHTFWLADTGVNGPQLPLTPSNGLIVAQPGIAVIFTGIHTGKVAVSIEVRNQAPQVTTSGWDEVVEVTMEVITGRVVVTGAQADAPDNLPVLTQGGPGHYRVRVHARGRDTAVDLVAVEPVEDYLIMVWPGRPASETTYRQSDQYGATLRQAASKST